MKKWKIIFFGDPAYRLDICHGYRLAARRVIGNRQIDHRYGVSPFFLDKLPEAFEVHIAFKRIFGVFSTFRYIKDGVVEEASGDDANGPDVTLCRVKMAIAGDE